MKEYDDNIKTEEEYLSDTIYISEGKCISKDPYILKTNGALYWVLTPYYFETVSDYYGTVKGYVRKTGQYTTYNGYTCVVCDSVYTDIEELHCLRKDTQSKIDVYKKMKKFKIKINSPTFTKSATTSSTGGLLRALKRAILLLAQKGGVASNITGPL